MSMKHIVEKQIWFFSNPNHIEEINTQRIKEALLQEAVKQCVFFCTDILIFFDYQWDKLIKGEIKEITLYFRQMGVDWGEKPSDNKYRSIAVLKRDILNDSLELIIELGNC